MMCPICDSRVSMFQWFKKGICPTCVNKYGNAQHAAVALWMKNICSGKSSTPMMKCGNCNVQHPTFMSKCPNCGAKATTGDPPENGPLPVDTEQIRRDLDIVLGYLAHKNYLDDDRSKALKEWLDSRVEKSWPRPPVLPKGVWGIRRSKPNVNVNAFRKPDKSLGKLLPLVFIISGLIGAVFMGLLGASLGEMFIASLIMGAMGSVVAWDIIDTMNYRGFYP